MKNKVRSVLRIKLMEDNSIVLLPLAIKSARGRTYTHTECANCVHLSENDWKTKGVDIVIDLLKQAPYSVDSAIKIAESKPTSSVFPIEFQNEFTTSYKIEKYIVAMTWLSTGDDSKYGRIDFYPTWNPYWAHEVFSFSKKPEQTHFINEMKRLFDKEKTKQNI